MSQVATPQQKVARNVRLMAWLLAIGVVLISLTVWSQVRLNGQLTGYDIFPLLGLTAFGLMWTHYITGAVRRVCGLDGSILKQYFSVTSAVVLCLILLHPTISSGMLWLDGLGLPPGSYLAVYSDGFSRLALLVAAMSLGTFLTFELYRWHKDKPWWRYVEYANIMAMFGILYHALTLGGELGVQWFRTVWYIYGATLFVAVIINYVYKKRGFR